MINLAAKKWKKPETKEIGTRITLLGVVFSHCADCEGLIRRKVKEIEDRAHHVRASSEVVKKPTIEPLSAYKT